MKCTEDVVPSVIAKKKSRCARFRVDGRNFAFGRKMGRRRATVEVIVPLSGEALIRVRPYRSRTFAEYTLEAVASLLLERRAKELAREICAARHSRKLLHAEKGKPAQVRRAWERLAEKAS